MIDTMDALEAFLIQLYQINRKVFILNEHVVALNLSGHFHRETPIFKIYNE